VENLKDGLPKKLGTTLNLFYEAPALPIEPGVFTLKPQIETQRGEKKFTI
jgi:hypothetical protein